MLPGAGRGDWAEPAEATRTVLLTVQFDGTRFAGWQRQAGQRTVQGALEAAVSRMVQHEVTVRGSSRTDAGVHARAMPATFQTPRAISADGFARGLNALLDEDVAVLAARDMPPGFEAREASVAKTYCYRVLTGPSRWPLLRHDRWWVREPLDLDALRAAAAQLVGEHDFAAFRSSACGARTTQRCLHSVEVSAHAEPPGVDLVVTGNAFLHNMVRILAGTLVDVGRGRLDVGAVARALASGDRRQAGQTAPARGLTLERVHFSGYPRLGKAAPRVAAGAEIG
jgi:tRNA pseudouridine38-40 synthase